MNILPKKSWHVKTRANIERVRRDEANAAEEEKKRLKKVELAEQEARTSLLRSRTQKRQLQDSGINHPLEETKTEGDAKAVAVISAEDELRKHVNFFREAEEGKSTGGTNKEREEEKKAEQEKYEKSIGLLTYLGQSAVESQTVKPWYLTTKKTTAEEEDDQTTDLKRKNSLDPMHSMNQYLKIKRKKDNPEGHDTRSSRPAIKSSSQYRTSNKLQYIQPVKPKQLEEKHKKHKHKKDHKHKKHSHKGKHSHKEKRKDREKGRQQEARRSGPSIEQLRAERLRREAMEKARTERLLSGKKETQESPRVVSEEPDGRYNSQFHPELARRHRPRDNVF